MRSVIILSVSVLLGCSQQDNLQPNLEMQRLLEQPDTSHVALVGVYDGVAVLRDASTREVVIENEQNLSEGHVALEVANALRSGHALSTKPDSQFTRLNDKSGTVRFGETAVRVSSVDRNAYLAEAWLLHKSDDGFWIQQEELKTQQTTYKGHTVDRLFAIGSLRLFDHDGNLIGSGKVDLARARGTLDYFAIDDAGDPYFLDYVGGRRKIEPVHLIPSDALAGEPAEPELPAIISSRTEQDLTSFEAAVRSTRDDVMLRPDSTTRKDILMRAELILNASWDFTEDNYALARNNTCRPASIWRRPTKLSASLVGSTISSPPYKWGGNADLVRFLEDVQDGAPAGDICTCRCNKGSECTAADWCIDESAVGFDCSGFVSQAWAIQYHSTATLHEKSLPIPWQELETGDVLISPGRHVRLFVGFADKNALEFDMIESSVGCGGLCRENFRASELVGYIAYQPKHLAQDH